MEVLDKKLVDELIRISKKIHKTGDMDLYGNYSNAKEKVEDIADWKVTNIISHLSNHAQLTNGTYQQIYDCLKILGYEVK